MDKIDERPRFAFVLINGAAAASELSPAKLLPWSTYPTIPLLTFLRSFLPVVRWQRHAPDVSWFVQLDSAAQRVLRIYIDDLTGSTFTRQVHLHRGYHSNEGAQTVRRTRSNRNILKDPGIRKRGTCELETQGTSATVKLAGIE